MLNYKAANTIMQLGFSALQANAAIMSQQASMFDMIHLRSANYCFVYSSIRYDNEDPSAAVNSCTTQGQGIHLWLHSTLIWRSSLIALLHAFD
jgi:hypothetical protein